MSKRNRGTLVALAVGAAFLAAQVSRGSTITVNSIADTIAIDGACTLREAIVAANTNVGTADCVAGQAAPGVTDTIAFNIPGAGVRLINIVGSNLPNITEAVVIDGTTQPGASPNTLPNGDNAVWLVQVSRGDSVPGSGFTTTGSGITIRGLDIESIPQAIVLGGSNNVAAGNLLALNPTAVATTGTGGHRIGGSAPADRNVVFGCGTCLALLGQAVVEGNFIGTDVTGNQVASATTVQGINAFADGTRIGGPGPGQGNVLGGFTNTAIEASAFGIVIQGNRIGVGTQGASLPIGNAGIRCSSGNLGAQAKVGGTAAGEANVIAHSGVAGIVVFESPGSSGAPLDCEISGNSISASGQIGIDLRGLSGGSGAGQDTNDPGDTDNGPNDLQNYPVIASALATGTQIQAAFSLDSTPNSTFRIEFFHSAACHPSGFGEGETFLGSTTVTTDAAGLVNVPNFALASTATTGVLTATATDTTVADPVTSEFSACAPLGLTPVVAVPALSTAGLVALIALLGGTAVALLRARRSSPNVALGM